MKFEKKKSYNKKSHKKFQNNEIWERKLSMYLSMNNFN